MLGSAGCPQQCVAYSCFVSLTPASASTSRKMAYETISLSVSRPSISKIKAFLFIGTILCFNGAFKRTELGHFLQNLSETFPLDVLVLPAKFSLTGFDIPFRKTIVTRSYKIICHLKDNIRKFKVFNPACVNAIEADD